MQLGGFTIKEKSHLENFDFSIDEIQARYGSFLNTGATGSPNSEDETGDVPQKPQKSGEEAQSNTNDARPDNSQSLDDWMNTLVETEKRDKSGGSSTRQDIHDNISKDFNDSNFWKESNYIDNPQLLDELLKEL